MFSCDTARARILRSNGDSFVHSAQYVVREQEVLTTLYEWETGEENSVWWRLRLDVTLDAFEAGFLAMFLHPNLHLRTRAAADAGRPTKAGPRGQGAAAVLIWLRESGRWPQLLAGARDERTLLSPDWQEHPVWAHTPDFKVSGSIYWAKLMAALAPDLCVPYDTRSRRLMLARLSDRRVYAGSRYRLFIQALHDGLRLQQERQGCTERAFRRLDAPTEAVPLEFPRLEAWLPVCRPLSRVVDKLFYTPLDVPARATATAAPRDQRGNEADWKDVSTLQGVRFHFRVDDHRTEWRSGPGAKAYHILSSEIEELLDWLANRNVAPLGADQQNPKAGGVGEWLRDHVERLGSPQHASHVVTVLRERGRVAAWLADGAGWVEAAERDAV